MGGLRPGFVAGGAKDEKVNSTLYARISQETFDETVKENMDDFDMSREDAIADAIEQFKMQVAPPVLCPHRNPRANARNASAPRAFFLRAAARARALVPRPRPAASCWSCDTLPFALSAQADWW